MLVAVLHPEHHLRRLSGVQGARARGRRVSVAGLREQHHQPHHLHRVQQDVQGGVHKAVALPVPEVCQKQEPRATVEDEQPVFLYTHELVRQ